MKTYFIIAIAIVLASLSVLALTDDNSEKREGQSYFLTPEGKLQQQEGQFIDTEFQQYKVDGLILFKGTCRWNANADTERKPAIVPVRLFRQDAKNKRLIPLAVYYTEEDGTFYLVAKDDGSDYMIGSVTNQAVNMPAKVKQFFDKFDKQKEESKR